MRILLPLWGSPGVFASFNMSSRTGVSWAAGLFETCYIGDFHFGHPEQLEQIKDQGAMSECVERHSRNPARLWVLQGCFANVNEMNIYVNSWSNNTDNSWNNDADRSDRHCCNWMRENFAKTEQEQRCCKRAQFSGTIVEVLQQAFVWNLFYLLFCLAQKNKYWEEVPMCSLIPTENTAEPQQWS